MARATRLTSEVRGQILGNLRLGCFDQEAAEAAGVPWETFHEWMLRGEGKHPTRKPTAVLTRFAREVRHAKAQARRDAEWEVRKTNPLAWLRYGPGRDRPEHPGWTDGSRAEVSEPSGEPLNFQLIIEQPKEKAAR
jgi:hypothetical protein